MQYILLSHTTVTLIKGQGHLNWHETIQLRSVLVGLVVNVALREQETWFQFTLLILR